ncbi:MAG: XdhC family protein, partial [Microcoleus sp. SIO2G3]|nr:XdhC family protein [Microcoleus sp. SIO2G3]
PALLKAFEQSALQHEATFLATVVKTQGSTYRRAGARLLMSRRGAIAGLVSGGCLEADIFEQTQQLTDRSIVLTYDHAAPEDIVCGLGLGCNGMVQVLLERLTDDLNPLQFVQHCFDRQQSGAIATVIHAPASLPLGSRLMLYADGTVQHNLHNEQLRSLLTLDVQTALHQTSPQLKQYELAIGQLEVLIEPIHPPLALMIFGTGADAIPVMQFAKKLGWQVAIVDCRSNAATLERFALADRVLLTRREKLTEQVSCDRTIAVVMTHNYLDDLEILRLLLHSKARYAGVLGPKRRTQQLLDELQIGDWPNQLYAPLGLDIGADTPDEIALAIVAEIQAVVCDRTGGFLKHRQGSIHHANPASRLDHSGSGSLDPHGHTQAVAHLSEPQPVTAYG